MGISSAALCAVEEYFERMEWRWLCEKCTTERRSKYCPVDYDVEEYDCLMRQYIEDMYEDLKDMFKQYEKTWQVK